MEYKKDKIDGIVITSLKKYEDARGYLIETFRYDTLPEGLTPKMSYVSFTNPGMSRGPHFHRYQTDVFAFSGPGNFQLKLWDIRKDSNTYGNFMDIITGEKNPILIVIPPGIIHGYRNISETSGMVLNFPDKLFKGKDKKEEVDEIRYENDPDSEFKLS